MPFFHFSTLKGKKNVIRHEMSVTFEFLSHYGDSAKKGIRPSSKMKREINEKLQLSKPTIEH